MKYSLHWLQTQIQKGTQPSYLFFWGHTPKNENSIDKSCFSQWYPSPFNINEVNYKTAEHWMMVKKALLFYDSETAEKILAAEKPAVAKALGRKVKNFDAAIWSNNAYNFVIEGNYHKFSEKEQLKNYLLNTGNAIIVEASPPDIIWGIGLPQDAPEAADPFKWRGTNLLGFALMEVRDQLNEQNATTT
jgi:hypothetical protein